MTEIPRGGLYFNLFKLLITTLPMCLERFAKNKHKGTNRTTLLGVFGAISGYLNVLYISKLHGVQPYHDD